MTELQQAILSVVQCIPAGKVMSYGQVAAYLGMPRGARQVGWTMSSMDGTPDFPWWRVLNNAGKITIRGNAMSNAEQQRALLEGEGIEIHDYRLDIGRYRFYPDAGQLESLGLDTAAIQQLMEKYDPEQSAGGAPSGQTSLL